jgi:glycosyltransferase involved in cell wall biosynthesis
LLKEADALHEAGYDARVVAMRLESAKAEWDDQLMSTRSWCLQTVNARRDSFAERFTWFKAGLRQRMYQRSASLQQWRMGVERTFCRYFPEMCRLAAREPADLFIAHNLQALPAAAYAAGHWQAKLGFDAEDFHRGEIRDDDPGQTARRQEIMTIEERYIPRCQYLTAASDGIGEAYARVLGVAKPVTILNVFPLSARQGHTPAEELRAERRGSGLSLYWYSQVIGRDRGLEDALEAVALLRSGVDLHLRGTWAAGYERAFRESARKRGIEDRVHTLAPAPPEELVERAAQHDVGLALEAGLTENRRIAVTNKILNYFLAGLAIAATDVAGQRRIVQDTPGAGVLYKPGDACSLARKLASWRDDPDLLRDAKVQSARYGEERFCWDREKFCLVRAVRAVCEPQ